MSKTLEQLYEQFPNATGFVYCDRGSGAGSGEYGRFIHRTADEDEKFGDMRLSALDKVIISTDGHHCLWASEWIVGGKENGPQYQFRIMF